ncbi:MAG: hypothetical protein ABNH00_04580 [Dokdonia sp.]|jgi:hypothetical protein|nr:hypothetical protein [Cytophagaceae bacterium]
MAKLTSWSSDKIVGVSAMGISFITLLIFLYQTNLMRKQNHLSILPYVAISISDDPANATYRLSLMNHGVGPAIIDQVVIKYKGEVIDLAQYDHVTLRFLQERRRSLDSLKSFSYATLEKGMAIPANTTYTILEAKQSAKDYALLKEALESIIAEGLYFEIYYSSIQQEHWRISNASQGPEKL